MRWPEEVTLWTWMLNELGVDADHVTDLRRSLRLTGNLPRTFDHPYRPLETRR